MGGTNMVVLIVGIMTISWVITTWIRAKHGYSITDDNGNTIQPPAKGMSDDDKARIAKLEKRIEVLERIATDRGNLLASEIDALKELPAMRTKQEVE